MEETVGTHFLGLLPIAYHDLVAKMGLPHSDGDGLKTHAEWRIRFEDGACCTIYNWKDGPRVWEIDLWHVGGHDASVLGRVREMLEAHVI